MYVEWALFNCEDFVAVHIDLQRILLCDVEGTAKLDGQHDAAQFVHTTDDAG